MYKRIMVQEHTVWAVLSALLAGSCMKINAKLFLTVICATIVVCLVLQPDDAVDPVKPDPNIVVAGVEDDATSARAGEMVPNPRLKGNERAQSPDEAPQHGHASFRHVVKPTRNSQVAKFNAFLNDAVENGFRP